MKNKKDPNLIPGTQVQGQLVGDDDPRGGIYPLVFPLDDPLAREFAVHDARYELHHQGDNSMTGKEADDSFEVAATIETKNNPDLMGSPLDSGFASWWNLKRVSVLSWFIRRFGPSVWRRKK